MPGSGFAQPGLFGLSTLPAYLYLSWSCSGLKHGLPYPSNHWLNEVVKRPDIQRLGNFRWTGLKSLQRADCLKARMIIIPNSFTRCVSAYDEVLWTWPGPRVNEMSLHKMQTGIWGVGIKEKEKERKWKDREKLVRPHHAKLGLWEGPWQDARHGRVGCFQEQVWPIFNSKKLFAGLGATWPFSSANIHYESVGHTT